MGTGRKKEFELIDGQPVLMRAVEPFLDCDAVVAVAVVYPRTLEEQTRKSLAPLFDRVAGRNAENSSDSTPSIQLVPGGATRQQSVRNGLLYLKSVAPDYILIHDGSRPWITCELIKKVLECVIEHGACIPAIPPVDALKRIDENGMIVEHVEKKKCYCAQTPQGFAYSGIVDAHELAAGDGKLYIDDAEVYAAYSGAVHVVEGDPANRKITFLHDLGTPGVEQQ
jgi:2-C-methyl-D-erythritol 4-phosphate cytidylyltransferase